MLVILNKFKMNGLKFEFAFSILEYQKQIVAKISKYHEKNVTEELLF